jgi:hypothetical protein
MDLPKEFEKRNLDGNDLQLVISIFLVCPSNQKMVILKVAFNFVHARKG